MVEEAKAHKTSVPWCTEHTATAEEPVQFRLGRRFNWVF